MSNITIKPSQALQAQRNLESLKDAIYKFCKKNYDTTLKDNVNTIPSFFTPEHNTTVLSDETKQLFDRIGRRTTAVFVKKQTARADKYNIPYDLDTVTFLELEREIDEYEELIDDAKKYDFRWDFSIYDPVGLEQEIEACKSQLAEEENHISQDYFHSISIS